MLVKKSGLVAALVALLAAAPAVPVLNGTPSSTAAAACTKAPTYGGSGTKFGVSLSASSSSSVGDDLKQEESRFGTKISVVRTWDNGVPTGDYWKKRSTWFGTRAMVVSLRPMPQDVLAGKYDTQLKNYFSTAPTNMPIFWNFWHEPEDEIKAGKFTATQYREAFKRIVDIAAGYCKSNLYPTLVLMGWTAESASKLNWKDYYPGSSYISVLAWDPYNGANGGVTSYKDPATIFDSVVNASKAAGKPFGIAETGSMRIPGDSAGTGRAAWLAKVASYLKSKNAVWVTYFQSTRKADFELRDSPSVTAWRSAL